MDNFKRNEMLRWCYSLIRICARLGEPTTLVFCARDPQLGELMPQD